LSLKFLDRFGLIGNHVQQVINAYSFRCERPDVIAWHPCPFETSKVSGDAAPISPFA
jgi:hypothetical protein